MYLQIIHKINKKLNKSFYITRTVYVQYRALGRILFFVHMLSHSAYEYTVSMCYVINAAVYPLTMYANTERCTEVMWNTKYSDDISFNLSIQRRYFYLYRRHIFNLFTQQVQVKIDYLIHINIQRNIIVFISINIINLIINH